MAPDVYIHDLRKPLPLDDNIVSAITVSHVLCIAIKEEEYPNFLRECHRVLQPGGVLRITDNNSDVFDFPSLSYTNASKMIKFLSEAGFEAKEVEPDETSYGQDTKICIDVHGGSPKAYFVEGVK
jgi:predicted SAM-dependent methyltransferase